MAEIKLNDSNFVSEVDSFRVAGEAVAEASNILIPSEGLSLPTVEAYQKRLSRIGNALYLFSKLTKKDADDMIALALKLKTADLTGN